MRKVADVVQKPYYRRRVCACVVCMGVCVLYGGAWRCVVCMGVCGLYGVHGGVWSVCGWRWPATEVVDTDVLQDVAGDELEAGSVRADDERRRQPREVVARKVRLPARVHHERLPQPAEAVQHDEGRRGARLQGLRHRHAAQLRTEVCPHPPCGAHASTI